MIPSIFPVAVACVIMGVPVVSTIEDMQDFGFTPDVGQEVRYTGYEGVFYFTLDGELDTVNSSGVCDAGPTAISGFQQFGVSNGGWGYPQNSSGEYEASPDQVQQDWIAAWFAFFATMVFVVWLMRKR